MSQNQTPWPGDKIPNMPRHALTQSERDQLQSFVVPSSTSPMQPPPNQPGDQTVSYYGMNSTSTSMNPQLITTPSTYMSAPPTSNHSTSMNAPSRSTSMAPHQYPSYDWSNTMVLPNMSAPMNSTFNHSHQPNTSTTQPNQWSPPQNDANTGIYAPQNYGSTALANSESIPQNQIVSASQYAMFPDNMGSPSQVIEDVAGPATPTGHNGVSPNFTEGTSMTPHAGTRQNSRTSSNSNSNSNSNDNHRSSKSRDNNNKKAPFKWRPGMKERKITDEMSAEEKKEASEWNYKYSEAKKAHTREQNRVSAQKSRQKKVELLEKTKTQVEHLEEDNARLQNHIAGLESAVQQLSTENMHLRSNNEILRQRVALLEQQIQVHNPHMALPALGNQNHTTPTLRPGVSQAQNFMQAPTPVLRQNPTPTTQNAPQGQAGLDFGLGSTTQAAQTLANNNGPMDQSQQPQQAQQPQQPDNIARDPQDDFIVDWMQVTLGDFQNSDPNSRPWSPHNGSAQ